MAYKSQLNKASAAATSYIDFEPQTELKKEAAVDTLVISLPGFSKEHLKVQVNNVGNLKVSGEKPEGTTTKRRFIKETTVSEHCDINGIRAKFINGELHVIMPKNPVVEEKEKEKEQEQEQEQEQEHEKEQGKLSPGMIKPKDDVPPPPMPKPEASEKKQMESPRINRKMEGLGGDLLMRLQGRNNNTVAIGFGVAVMAMVAFGAFIAHKYGSSSSTSSYMEEL